MAKAKTGTRKTIAFLLPSIEVVVNSPPVRRHQKRPPILVLVKCPTRELANQAAKEANTLLKYHPSIGVQVVIEGTKLPAEQKSMHASPCLILVAMPGRLRDHLENTPGFATRLKRVKVLVLDEADFRFGYCAQGDRIRKVGVVDSEYVLHQGIQTFGGASEKKIPSSQESTKPTFDMRSWVRKKSTKLQIFKDRWEKAVEEDRSWVDPYEKHYSLSLFEQDTRRHRGLLHRNGWPEMLKLKDWPASNTFDECLPRHGSEFISMLSLQ
ncbi:hypothetical protein Droror1_Dr00023421 [Drosera rotundifolia]